MANIQQICNEFTEQEDQVLFNEVVVTLNDLGHYNRLTNKYQLNLSDHNACLRDLIRFLRNDGGNFLVRRQMGISNIVDNDLLPIIEQHTISERNKITESGEKIMDKVIRLLVDLTNPTVLHYSDQKIPKEDKYEMNIYMELQNYLFQYKLSFSFRKRFWAVLSKFLSRILEKDVDDIQMEDEMMLERILILIRNVLHIPIVSSGRKESDNGVHDRIIELMNDSGLLDIIQFMIANSDYTRYCFHLLEILYLIYREQNAEFLAKSVVEELRNGFDSRQNSPSTFARNQYEREIDRKEFEDARHRDQQDQLRLMAKMKQDDFTRFKETAFVIKNIQGVSDRDMICYRAYSNPEKALDFNRTKTRQRRPKNRRPMNESVGNSDWCGQQLIHRSNRKLRVLLHEFCAKFLTESYNQFMSEIRTNLVRGIAQEHDEIFFLWACQFFMEFNRYQSNIPNEQKYQQIYETLCTGLFHYIQTTIDNYLDHLQQKKEFKQEIGDWSKRLHQALRAYKELLFSLSYIESLNLPWATKMCFNIKSDIFVEPEYRELLLRLMHNFNEEKMSKPFLRDLIETNHLFLKMLEYHAKISLDFKIKVKKKKRKTRSSNKVVKEKQNSVDDNSGEKNDQSPDLVWIEINEQLIESLNKIDLNSEKLLDQKLTSKLFDTSQNLDDQKLNIMREINRFLMQKQTDEAVVLYREARNVMLGIDDENVFGETDIEIDEELMSLSTILMAKFPEQKSSDELQDENDEVSENETEEIAQIQERSFSIDETLMRYAHPNCVRSCRLLLRYYRTNSPSTNHAIVKLLYRIAVDLKMKPMFYNLGYFLLFENILDDPLLKSSSGVENLRYKSLCELATFSMYILRSFFKLLSKHPKISSEICFQATSRDAYQMEYGFDEQLVNEMIKEKKGIGWSEAQLLELQVLHNEYQSTSDRTKDVVDFIQDHLIDETKTRRQIVKQLKKMVCFF